MKKIKLAIALNIICAMDVSAAQCEASASPINIKINIAQAIETIDL